MYIQTTEKEENRCRKTESQQIWNSGTKTAISGLGGVVWILVWAVVASDEPATSRFISSEERKFLVDRVPKKQTVSKELFSLKTIVTI